MRKSTLLTTAIVALAIGMPAAAHDDHNEVSITTDADYRYIVSNGIPDHDTGQFPNRGNPHEISEQEHVFRVPLTPEVADAPTPIVRGVFGVALNGVPFDPGTAEYWNNDRQSGWRYEALGGGRNLGLDHANGHVQPGGTYHYHGTSDALAGDPSGTEHSALVGYAADGFPVYSIHGYADGSNAASAIVELTSSYQLLSGTRPDGPGGAYDGTFVEDFAYVAGSGDLDACNGRFTVTPEHPDGTYAYFLTETYPYIPRCVSGTADASFQRQPLLSGGPGVGAPPRGNRPSGPPRG
ncbi:MAG: YHYH protein [Pseudomonadota bacterium]